MIQHGCKLDEANANSRRVYAQLWNLSEKGLSFFLIDLAQNLTPSLSSMIIHYRPQ